MDETAISVDLPLLISRWVHISSVVAAIGGVVFMRFGLMPAANEALTEEAHAELREAVRRRWAKFVHGSIAMLLLTGFYNFYALAIKPGVDPVYHAIFGPKILLAFGVFFIGSGLLARSTAFAWMQRDRKKWSGVLLVLAALIILLSGILNQVRGSTQSRTGPNSPAATSGAGAGHGEADKPGIAG